MSVISDKAYECFKCRYVGKFKIVERRKSTNGWLVTYGCPKCDEIFEGVIWTNKNIKQGSQTTLDPLGVHHLHKGKRRYS